MPKYSKGQLMNQKYSHGNIITRIYAKGILIYNNINLYDTNTEVMLDTLNEIMEMNYENDLIYSTNIYDIVNEIMLDVDAETLKISS